MHSHPKALNSLGYIAVLAIMGSAIAVIIFNKLIKMTEHFCYIMYIHNSNNCNYMGISDNEIITKHDIIGFMIILGGVYLVNKEPNLFCEFHLIV